MIKRLAIVIFISTICLSCASIMSGGSQRIDIRTQPSSATVSVLDQYGMEIMRVTTPAAIVLSRGKGYFSGASYMLKISKEGYAEKTVALMSGLNGGWYIAGNIIFGYLLGWILIDPLTGAMWSLYPEIVNEVLQTQ